MIKRPDIRKRLLPVNMFSRPGKKLVSIKGIVVHWTGNPELDAEGHVTYFKNLAKQDPDDEKFDRYAGAHYFVGTKGEILQLIPDDEVAYHVGAKSYHEETLDKFNTTYPNNCLIGIELCHPDSTGEFTEETWNSAVRLIGYLIEEHDLTKSDVVRHYDVTGKLCPKWFVEDDDAYSKFREAISYVLYESSVHNKKIERIPRGATRSFLL